MAGNRRALLGVAVALVLLPFGVLLHQVRTGGPLDRFDVDAAAEVHDWAVHSDAAVSVSRAVTRLGGNPVLSVVAVAAVLFLVSRNRTRLAVFVLVAAVGESVIIRVVKTMVGRDRPSFPDPIDVATGRSFPSGHAMGATVVWGAVLLALIGFVAPRWRRPAIAAVVVLIAGVGLTRVVLGVHYPSDVLAGHVLGVAWLAVAMAIVAVWPEPQRDPDCGPDGPGR